MVAVQVPTLDGQGSMLSGATVEEFKQRLRGEWLLAPLWGFGSPVADTIALSIWTDPANSQRNIRWARVLFAAWEPHLPRAVYVNDLGDEGGGRAQSAYGANYARLMALKTQYNPTNVFRLNQNMKPTG